MNINQLDQQFIINLTPHSITIGNTTVEPSGNIARVATEEIPGQPVHGIPTIIRKMGNVDFGNIKASKHHIFIVSSMVLDAIPPNHPLAARCFAPDTGNSAIRNDKGHVTSVTRLVRHKNS
jgi:hypothetical protein